MSLDPVTAVLDIGGKLIDRLWPDPVQQATAKLELLKLQTSGELQTISGQLQVNQEEAKSASVFVSGWRPFIGWIGGLGLAYVAIAEPIARFIAIMQGYTGAFPVIDTAITFQVLLGMLGLSGMRTFEKVQGVASK